MTSILDQHPNFIIKDNESFVATWDDVTYTFVAEDRKGIGPVGFLIKETPSIRRKLAETVSFRQAESIVRNDIFAEFLTRQVLSNT